MTFADKVIAFNRTLNFQGELPPGIRIMNPFREDETIIPISSSFYQKFYNDAKPRRMILGINPGRFGAGVTGVPFTDTKRLTEQCGIAYSGKETHEPSSVFVYDVIEAYGGTHRFYQDFYINSLCPLGFTKMDAKGRETNYNYYDSQELTEAVREFIVASVRRQLEFGVRTDICYCFGTGKNERFMRALNQEYRFFDRIIPLEHPRYIVQYKLKSKQQYIDKYLEALRA